jgi:hypothetical protein
MQQQLHAPAQEHLLEHDSQDFVMKHGTTFADGSEGLEIVQDLIKDFALTSELTAEVRHTTGCQVPAAHGESFHEQNFGS